MPLRQRQLDGRIDAVTAILPVIDNPGARRGKHRKKRCCKRRRGDGAAPDERAGNLSIVEEDCGAGGKI